MSRYARLFLLALLLGWQGPALADLESDLRDSMRAIMEADEAIGQDPKAEINLDQPIAILSRVIEDRQVNAAVLSVARYWRARAYTTLNWSRMGKGQKPDAELARKSLQDYDDVATAGVQVRGWVSVPDSIYGAGGVAFNHLGDKPLAYRYWQRCAAAGHAGCLNIMASARLTGAGGVAVDLDQSIALDGMVYDTGTDFRCAGAYSALMNAQIIHFAGLKGQTVGELDWIGRAYPLLDELQKEEKNDNPCDRAFFEISEYLMRLARGERKPELLRAAAARTAGNDLRSAARYLLGDMSREAFDKAAQAIALKHVACSAHFIGAWHAALERDTARLARYTDAMNTLGECEISLALLRLKKNS